MISYVKGELVEIADELIVVDNNGLGFNIRVPASVLSNLPRIGNEVKIYTYLQIREDAHVLYGFLSREELEVFKMLIIVNGIGSKNALGILGAISVDNLKYAIISEDVKLITSAPGIGTKIAQKLILELKDKIKLVNAESFAEGGGKLISDSNSTAKAEAVEALMSLGYSSSEAYKAVSSIADIDSKDSECILKEALKKLAII